MAGLALASCSTGEVPLSWFLQISPILAALRRHKTEVALLVFEIALTIAVLANLMFIVNCEVQRSHLSTGVAEGQLGLIQSIGVIGYQNTSSTANNILLLRMVAGVTDVAFGGLPLWREDRNPVFLDAGRQNKVAQSYTFVGTEGLARTLGAHIIAGREMVGDEMPAFDEVFGGKGAGAIPVLLTRALGMRLFGAKPLLGRVFYCGNYEVRVVGVIDHLRAAITGAADDDYAIIIEFDPGSANLGGSFVIRTKPGRLSQTLLAAADALKQANPGHVQPNVLTMPELRARYFRGALSTGRMLMAIIFILVLVTALGVGGLANFWVLQRRRQIGMRRALGGTRGNILRYFQIENFLLVSAGVALGAVLAYFLNLFLMRRFEVSHLPPHYLVGSAIVLWLVGQLSVLGPAVMASNTSPAEATRT